MDYVYMAATGNFACDADILLVNVIMYAQMFQNDKELMLLVIRNKHSTTFATIGICTMYAKSVQH